MRAETTPRVKKMNSLEEDSKMEQCECGSTQFIETAGFVVCQKCGLCQARIYDASVQFDEDHADVATNNRGVSRGNTPELASGLGSFIGTYYSDCSRDFIGNRINSTNVARWTYLSKKYNRGILVEHKTKVLLRLKIILNEFLDCIDVSEALKTSCHNNLNKAVKKGLLVVANSTELITATIYWTFRNEHFIYKFNDLCQLILNRGYRIHEKRIIEVGGILNDLFGKTTANKAEDYLESSINLILRKFSKKVDLPQLKNAKIVDAKYCQQMLKVSQQILENIPATSQIRGGTNPYIFTGAVIYCAGRIVSHGRKETIRLGQSHVAFLLNIAEYSIRDIYLKRLKPLFKNYPAFKN
jgi:hypothetical protein